MPEPTPSHAAADRNLLFGILALQMDFISRDGLIEAMHTWVLDKARPLGQVLLGQGRLTPERLQLLEALVAEHLKAHGGDPQESLAAVSAPASLGHEVCGIPDADIQASLASLAAPPSTDTQATGPYLPRPKDGALGGRYRVLRPHARGGLGEVFVAQDTELGREVALKEIRPEHARDARSRGRFLLEAQITGGLEHPGIVPVYGLGFYPDGRPFYAMRLVRGETLKEAIRRFHAAEGPGRDSGERRLALRHLLSQFIAIRNAVAYAHSRGILHRDLKPANAILGRYGEALVLDWGLAKTAGTAEPERDTSELPLRPTSGEPVATQAGTTLGTPAYMSPEQAEGRWEKVSRVSDVYGLGATLYTLLTGRPPVEGEDRGELLRKAARAEWRPPRQIKSDVPAALDAVCRKAMAHDPKARYPGALELAADIEHWLADEPISAWREPLRVRSGRWVRRHKPAVAALAAAALVALLLGGAGLVWLERQAEARRRGVEAALEKAAEMQGQAHWAEAQAVLEQAKDRLNKGGPPDLRQRLGRAQLELKLVGRLDAIQLKRATWVDGWFDNAGADREYAAAFLEAGLGAVGQEPRAVAARVRASRIRQALVDALHDWAVFQRKGPRLHWVLEVARQGDPNPWRDRVRNPKIWTDRTALSCIAREASARLVGEAPAGSVAPRFVGFLALRLAWLRGDAEGLLRVAQAQRPADFWVNFTLGNILRKKERGEEAVGFYRAALAVRPDAAAVHNNLGTLMCDHLKDYKAAAACFRRAIALGLKDGRVHYNLGNALYGQRKLGEAVTEYRRAVKLVPKAAIVHSNLALALDDQGKLRDAIAEYHRAITLDPKHAIAQHNLGRLLNDQLKDHKAAAACFRRAITLDPKDAEAHNGLGLALKGQGDVAGATAEFRKAIALGPELAEAHCNLGAALRHQGRLQESLDCYRRGHRLGVRRRDWRYPSAQWVKKAERLVELDKQLPAFLQGSHKPRNADDCLALAVLCGLQRRYAGAAHFFAEAFSRLPQLAADRSAGYRYNAACYAALAGAGRGQDAGRLDSKKKARLRGRALAWLRAELTLWARQLTGGKPRGRQIAKQRLRHWQIDPDLAGVRDKKALAGLAAAERGDWKQFWAEVRRLAN
jgi:serine/threonine-protein kinase